MIFKLGELFCGPGGIGYAAINANISKKNFAIQHAWATDYDKDACDTYRFNVSPKSPKSVICEDVRNLDIEKLEPIDAFAFGFPCNDYSVVGEQK